MSILLLELFFTDFIRTFLLVFTG